MDNVCAFVRPGEVVLAWTDDREDPQYEMSMEDLRILEKETDAKGRHFVVHKLPFLRFLSVLRKRNWLALPLNPVKMSGNLVNGWLPAM